MTIDIVVTLITNIFTVHHLTPTLLSVIDYSFPSSGRFDRQEMFLGSVEEHIDLL